MIEKRLKKYLLSLIVLTIVLGVLIVSVESGNRINNIGDGLWWAITTVTTVGYGDMVPLTGLGRIIGAIMMLGGVAIFWLVIALITSSFNKKQEKYINQRLKADLESINNKLYRLEHKLDYLIKGK